MNKKTIFIETNYIVCILFPLKVKTSVCLQCICPCQVTLYRRYTDKLYILKQTPSATLCNKMTSSNKVNFQKMFLINSTEGTLVAKLFSWNVRKVSIGCDQHAHLWQLNKEYTTQTDGDGDTRLNVQSPFARPRISTSNFGIFKD